MGDVINQSKIWKFVGDVAAITGLVSFSHSSPYRMSLGKLGYGGHVVYLFICSFICWLIIWGKRIQVPVKFKGLVKAILFAVLFLISVVYDKYVPKKSDAYAITSYGLFALMSVSLSRKFDLGFEIGFSAFFLHLFALHFFNIKWSLALLALVCCSIIIILGSCPEESEVQQAGSITPNNGSHRPPNSVTIEVQRQDSVRQSLLSTTNNQENNEAETSQAAMLHSPSNGQVSDQGSIFDDEEEETRWSFSNGNGRSEELLPSETVRKTDSHEHLNVQRQYSQEQNLLPTNNQEYNGAESSQAAMNRSPSIRQVPEGSMMPLDPGNPQNREEVPDRSIMLYTEGAIGGGIERSMNINIKLGQIRDMMSEFPSLKQDADIDEVSLVSVVETLVVVNTALASLLPPERKKHVSEEKIPKKKVPDSYEKHRYTKHELTSKPRRRKLRGTSKT